MFQLLCLFVVGTHSKEISSLMDTIVSNPLCNEILSTLQSMNGDVQTSHYDVISYINQMEDKVVQEILNDMNVYQLDQTKNLEQKQELKYQIQLTKFTQNAQNDELQLLQNESKLSEDIRSQRQELLSDLESLLPNLETLHRDEEAQYDNIQTQLMQILKLIMQFEQKQNKNDQIPLSGQRTHKTKEYNNAQDLLLDLQDKQDNPFVEILNQLSTNNQNDKIKDLQELVNEKMKYIKELFDQRIKQFNLMKDKLQQDNDRWKLDMQQIEPIAKITKEKLQHLNSQSDEIQNALNQQQIKFNQIQDIIDNNYTSYSSKRLQDMNNLNVVRMLKQILNENYDAFEDFLKNKFVKQQI